MMNKIKNAQTVVEEILRNESEGMRNLVIREGSALSLHHPKNVTLEGAIDTPSRFLANRKDDFEMNKVNAVVSREDRLIILQVNELDEHGSYKAVGQIKISKELKELKINAGEGWSPEQLSNALKLKRSYFPSIGDHAKIVATLRNLKAKINKIVENDDDTRGNVDRKFKQTVESNMPEAFEIMIPLFKGSEKVNFDVSVTLEANGSHDITCYLESVDASEMIDRHSDEKLDEEIKKLEEHGILIYEK